jgi:hypothetical protein
MSTGGAVAPTLSHDTSWRHFVRHFLEMVVAMIVGMAVLGAIIRLILLPLIRKSTVSGEAAAPGGAQRSRVQAGSVVPG